MAQLIVRKIDDAAYSRLKQRAKLNKRSLEAEVRVILEAAAKPDRTEFARWCEEFHKRMKPAPAGEFTRWIREDRDSH